MPLILAIEPDRRQANQLNAVVKGLHADLVLADSAEEALAALGDRVPDLILTTALLSPTDEVVLGDRLRSLNGAAAHVQTLTIPVLAGAPPRVRSRAAGMLAALRRSRPQPDNAPDGCDPTMFASQCAEYLERAAADRATHAAAASRRADEVIHEDIEIVPVTTVGESALDAVTHEPEAAGAPEPFVDFMTSMLDPIRTDEEPRQEFVAEEMSRDRGEQHDEVHEASVDSLTPVNEDRDLAHESAAPTSSFDDDQPARPVRPAAIPLIIDAPAAAATVQLAIAQIEALVACEEFGTETIAVVETAESVADRPAAADPEGFVELDLSTLLGYPTVDSPSARGDEQAVRESSAFGDEDVVYDLNVSVDSTPPIAVPAPPPVPAPMPAADDLASVFSPRRSSNRKARKKAAKDEWAFFDPEKCGFAALLAKLDEIIETEDPATPEV